MNEIHQAKNNQELLNARLWEANAKRQRPEVVRRISDAFAILETALVFHNKRDTDKIIEQYSGLYQRANGSPSTLRCACVCWCESIEYATTLLDTLMNMWQADRGVLIHDNSQEVGVAEVTCRDIIARVHHWIRLDGEDLVLFSQTDQSGVCVEWQTRPDLSGSVVHVTFWIK